MGFLILFIFFKTNFFVSLFSFLIIYIAHYYFKYFTRPNPLPGPFPLPIIGNLYLFKLDDYSRYAKHCHEKYGDLFEIYLGGKRQIFIGRLDVFDKLLNSSSKTNFKLKNQDWTNIRSFGFIWGC